MDIRHLTHAQIDRDRWDATIRQAANRLPYAYSWYLDAVCPGRWNALVERDYHWVMPLPWNDRLLGYRQLYQPPFCQQLGVFGKEVGSKHTERFLLAIPKRYRYQDIQLNTQCRPPASWPRVSVQPRTNLLLDLQPPYPDLHAHYSKSLRKRLRKAQDQLQFRQLSDAELIVPFYRQNLAGQVDLPHTHYRAIYRLIEAARSQGAVHMYGIYDEQGELCASGLFVASAGRIVNLFGSSNERGRAVHAMHFLLDRIIHTYSGQKLTFDFEGSDIPGVAAFFRSFGPEEEIYYRYQLDRLPGWVRSLRYWRSKKW